MKLRLLFSALTLLPLAATADTLYKCTNEDGQVLYTNQKGAAKACTILSRDLAKPAGTAAGKARATPTPSEFPRVSGDQQKARDNDRRAILDQELANEQKQLDEAKKALAEQERADSSRSGNANPAKGADRLQSYRDGVQLHERNIEALNKEIGNLH
jgi:hypothetical protein